MLRKILGAKKRAIVILPFISVVVEKEKFMKRVYSSLGLLIEGYYANKGGQSMFDHEEDELNIAICTIEKANSLLNRAVEEGKIEDIGIVIIDEIHMMGDSSRGYILELLVTKLLYLQINHLQIVGLSATLPNINIFYEWLKASIYITNYRPVPLIEFIKVENTIYDNKLNKSRMLIPNTEINHGLSLKNENEQILHLCLETIRENNSILIFCSSKRNTENLCTKLSSLFPDEIRKKLYLNKNLSEHFKLINELKRTPGGLDPILEKSIPTFIGYHHSGLTVEEREIIENGFRDGVIKILTATSTLAAGVNLPARRVIFHNPFIGIDFLDATRYQQMSGRAGRKGIDIKGESFLCCKSNQLNQVKNKILSSLLPLESCLVEERRGMIRPLMDVIASGVVETLKDVERYIMNTLFAKQKCVSEVHKVSKSALRFLEENDFLEYNEKLSSFSPTKLGKATVASALSPEEGLVVFNELKKARQQMILDNELHIVYQVTPIYHNITPDWDIYLSIYSKLKSDYIKVANLVGVNEEFLVYATSNRPNNNNNNNNNHNHNSSHSDLIYYNKYSEFDIHTRFFAALILNDLTKEISISSVSQFYHVPRGHLQALQTTASSFCGMVTIFCQQLKWWSLHSLFSNFSDRLCFGVEPDIIPLAQIPHVKGHRARILYKKGFKTISSIAAADPKIIEDILRQDAPYKHSKDEDSNQIKKIEERISKLIVNGAKQLVNEHSCFLEKSLTKHRSSTSMSSGNHSSLNSPKKSSLYSPNKGSSKSPKKIQKKSFHHSIHDNLNSIDNHDNDDIPKPLFSPSNSNNNFSILPLQSKQPSSSFIKTPSPIPLQSLKYPSPSSSSSSSSLNIQQSKLINPSLPGSVSNVQQSSSSSSLLPKPPASVRQIQINQSPSTNSNHLNQSPSNVNQSPSSNSNLSPSFMNPNQNLRNQSPSSVNQSPSFMNLRNQSPSNMNQSPLSNTSNQIKALPKVKQLPNVRKLQSPTSINRPTPQNQPPPLHTNKLTTSSNTNRTTTLLSPKTLINQNQSPSTINQSPSSNTSNPQSPSFMNSNQKLRNQSPSSVNRSPLSNTSNQSPSNVNQSPNPSNVAPIQSLHQSSNAQPLPFPNLTSNKPAGTPKTNINPSLSKTRFISPPKGQISIQLSNINQNKNGSSPLPLPIKALPKLPCKPNIYPTNPNHVNNTTSIINPNYSVNKTNNTIKSPPLHQNTTPIRNNQTKLQNKPTTTIKKQQNPSKIQIKQNIPLQQINQTTIQIKSPKFLSPPPIQRKINEKPQKENQIPFKVQKNDQDCIITSSPPSSSNYFLTQENITKNIANFNQEEIIENMNSFLSSIPNQNEKQQSMENEKLKFSEPSPPEILKKIGCIHPASSCFPFTIITVYESFQAYEELLKLWSQQAHYSFSLLTSIHGNNEYSTSHYEFDINGKLKSNHFINQIQQNNQQQQQQINNYLNPPIEKKITKKQQKLLEEMPHLIDIDGISVCWNESQVFFLSLRPLYNNNNQSSSSSPSFLIQLEAYRWQLIRRVMVQSTAHKTAYEMTSKYQLLLECGIRVHKTLQDPRIAAWMIDPEDKNSGSLDFLMERYLPSKKIIGSSSYPIGKCSKETMQSYILMDYLLKRLKTDILYNPFRDIEMEIVPILSEMQHWGMGFKKNICKDHHDIVSNTLLALENQSHKLIGKKFSLTAPIEISNILFNQLNLPCSKELVSKTRKNQAPRKSTSAQVLQNIKHLHPLPNLILQHRKLTTLKIKYMNNLPKYASFNPWLKMDRIHSIQLHTHSPTGRLAVKNPNLQCIPHTTSFISHGNILSQEQQSISIRDAFEAADHCVLLSADYSQLEVRLMTHFSQDPLLLQIFKKGGDIFKNLASQWLNKPPDEITHEERNQGKRVCYGMLYGIGARALAESLEISNEKAQSLLDSFKKTYKGVTNYLESAIIDARKKSYIETICGRRRYFPDLKSNDTSLRLAAERAAINTICQGSAADLVKIAMVRIWRRLEADIRISHVPCHIYKRTTGTHALASQLSSQLPSTSQCTISSSRLLLQIHDELLFEVPEKDLLIVQDIVREEMETSLEISIPFIVNISVGKTWGSLKPVS